MTKLSLHLAKENFKFSAAHFLIFDEKSAERLHGHNYRVRVEIGANDHADLVSGFFIDFHALKKQIKSTIDRWDEYVLFPAQHPEIKFKEVGEILEVRFRERFYAFPKNEVVLLPISNTSVEHLAGLLAKDLMQQFGGYKLSHLTVMVEESAGQGASVTMRV